MSSDVNVGDKVRTASSLPGLEGAGRSSTGVLAKIANYVLGKIYEADSVQYNELLKGIGEPKRVT